MSSKHTSARSLAVALALLASIGTAACARPCDELASQVCDLEPHDRHCALMQDPGRRDLLSDDACAHILEIIRVR